MNDDHSLKGSWARLSQVAVKGAQYNSPERHPHPKCLEGTRVDLLKYIYGCLDDPDKNQLIWLHGTAGVGKSSVAFTVAEKMRDLKVTEETNVEMRLGGTFFFSREKTERRTAGYFFATLVYQLATRFSSIQEYVSRVIRDNPALLDPDTPLRDQMEALFLKPLRSLQPRLHGCLPLSFVVDALDECTSEDEVADLILSLARALRDPDLPVTHILLTSRSESHISEVFQNDDVRALVREIPVRTSGEGGMISLDGADVDNDICTFLRHSFTKLGSRHRDFPQPSEGDLAKLASRAGRRFIVASTMMKFIINDEDSDPRDRLNLMLDLTSKLLLGTEVYKLYDLILSTCTDPKRAYLHLSLVAALADPLPISQISTLLGPGLGRDVQTTLIQLRSVMDIPTDSALPVNIYHSSIRDYVSDLSNCSLPQVRDIGSPHPHTLLARSSLRLMMGIPKSTALLDALSELKKQSKAMEPEDPHKLKESLAFLVQSPKPLSAVICMLWLRGDRSSDLQSWLGTVNGHAWLQTQGGRDWLQILSGQEWMKTQGGREWMKTQGGREWLQTQGGREWLQTQGPDWLWTEGGQDWMNTREGNYWLSCLVNDRMQAPGRRYRMQTPRGQDLLQTRDRMQTQGGQDWLQTQEKRDWLRTQGGRCWLRTQGGRDWLQTQHGEDWLQTQEGRDWLRKQGGLQTKGGRDWLLGQGGRDWLQTQEGRDWLQTQEGQDWLQTQAGQDWLQNEGGRDWLQTEEGQDWLQTRDGRYWLQTQAGQDWLQTRGGLRTQGGRHWLQTQAGQDWLETSEALDWLETQGGQDWLQTPYARQWLQTLNGQYWLDTLEGRDWLRNLGGRDWLLSQGGGEWLKTWMGRQWLESQQGRDWLQTEGGGDWLQTQAGRDWLQTQDGQDWLQTQGGQDWLQTHGRRARLQTQEGRDWLQTQGGRDWLQTQGGQDWVQTPYGRQWLQSPCGRDWLQTPHGQAWQSTPAASVWVTMEEFSRISEVINEYIVTSNASLLPAFQVIQHLKTLPDFLMFPVCLALRHTVSAKQALYLPDREIIHAMNTFESFANEALERSQAASGALKYACHNWAIHLSRVLNPWDDTLNHIFHAFLNDHMVPWLEMQWCLKGLRSCLAILSEGQKFVP